MSRNVTVTLTPAEVDALINGIEEIEVHRDGEVYSRAARETINALRRVYRKARKEQDRHEGRYVKAL